MTPSSKALSAAYEACFAEAFKQCPMLINRWCVKLVDSLYERSMMVSDAAEKYLLQDAISALKKNQSTIEQKFLVILTQFIASDTQSAAAKNKVSANRSFSSLSFDDLELMGDTQIQETVNSTRLLQVVSLSCESGLAGFTARLSTAQGLKVVKADRNPLRPEIISLALIKLLQDLPVAETARSRWLMCGAQPMGYELQKLYILLNQLLEEHGVAPAAYNVISSRGDINRISADFETSTGNLGTVLTSSARAAVQSPSERVTLSGAARNSSSNSAAQLTSRADGAVQVSREQLLTLDHLHRLMIGDYDGSFNPATIASTEAGTLKQTETGQLDFSLTEPGEVSAGNTLDELHKMVQPAPHLPVALMREQFKAEAKSVGQSLAIEMVGLMMDKLTGDTRLLAPVRQVIANVEPAFLRLGMTDPRFFSDKSHPARQLLNSITAKSLAYANEDTPGFAVFLRNLQEVADSLTQELASDAQYFAALLHRLESKETGPTPEISESQNRAVQALLKAEQRNLLAEKIASEIRNRSDFVSSNRIIAVFLTGPWAQVMARERLLGGIGSSKAVFSLTLGEVLWSLNVAQASRNRKRLISIIPGILNSVREGLLTIDFPLEKSKVFFDELMQVHQSALKSEPVQPKTREELDKAFEAAELARGEVYSTQPWLAPTEAQESGFMEIEEEEKKPEPELNNPGSQASEKDANDVKPVFAEDVNLRLGDWVELLSAMTWHRAQLTWISPHNTLFMFTGEGGRSHSMTARMLHQLMDLNRIKVISQQGLLDGALDSIAQTAMRNSVNMGRSVYSAR